MPFINIGTVVPFPAHIVQEAGAYSGEMEGGGWWGPPPKKGPKREEKWENILFCGLGKSFSCFEHILFIIFQFSR